MNQTGHIHLRVPMFRKNSYVHAAQQHGLSLSAWMTDTCDKAVQAACRHKFVDSDRCLKCGWKPPIVKVCAWCPPQPVPPGALVSHGICDHHALEMRNNLPDAAPRQSSPSGTSDPPQANPTSGTH